MVAISRRCYSCADKAVQISQVVFFDKGAQPELLQKKRNRLISHDIRFYSWLALLVPNFLTIISILLYVSCIQRESELERAIMIRQKVCPFDAVVFFISFKIGNTCKSVSVLYVASTIFQLHRNGSSWVEPELN